MNIDKVINRVNERIDKLLPRDFASLSGGKRMRARLFLAFAGSEKDENVNIASAIELIHAATLIHDDILDNASTRRGEPSLFSKRGIPESVLFGDYLFSRAFSVISEAMDPLLNREMTNALSELLEGEILEKQTSGEIHQDKEKYFSIIRKKTGVLFGLSSKLGAMQTGEDLLKQAYEFGINAGTAYQIVDDLLDYFGEELDKDRFNDIKEGTVTLPLIYLMERCTEDERRQVGRVFAKKNASSADLDGIQKIMERYNVPKDVIKTAAMFLKDAEEALARESYAEVASRFDILSGIKEQAGI